MQKIILQRLMELHGTVIPLAILMLEDEEDRNFMSDLYLNHKALMYKTAKRYFPGKAEELEDAVSDAVLNMCKYCRTVRKVPEERLEKYIVCIVRNACNWRCRQIYADRDALVEETDVSELEKIADEDALHENVLSRQIAIEMLDSFRQLGERDKELIRMRHIDMLEYEEMAELLGLSQTATRTAVSRAKQRLEAAAKNSSQSLEV